MTTTIIIIIIQAVSDKSINDNNNNNNNNTGNNTGNLSYYPQGYLDTCVNRIVSFISDKCQRSPNIYLCDFLNYTGDGFL